MIRVTFNSPRKGRVLVQARRDEKLLFMETVSPGDTKQCRPVAMSLGMAVEALQEKLMATEGSFDIEESAGVGLVTYGLRKIDEPRENGTYYPTIDEALANSIPDGVIEWEGKDQCCVLDVDYHHVSEPPPSSFLMGLVQKVQPSPLYFWLSKGGGLHFIYCSIDGIPANELAAAAAISWVSLEPGSTVDLLNSTRCPPGQYFRTKASTDLSAVAKYLGSEVSPDVIEQYLTDHGLTMGQAFAHSACPCRPSHDSHGTPVFVSEHGLICKSCEAGGFCLGSRRPGFFPYTALCGAGPSNLVRSMARSFCHWEHAKIVLEDKLHLTGETARLAWKAMLRLVHGNDPRVDRAMVAGRNVIRLDRRWTTKDALATYTKDIGPILAALPACQTKDGAIIGEQVARFNQQIDLDEEGYPSITPIPGVRMYSHRLSLPDERVTMVVPNWSLRSPAMANRRPRYVESGKRIADAWGILEEPFPGIDRNYLTLLIAAKGIVEAQLGMAPNILVSGPASAGKTSTAHIAAAITGDKCTDVVWQADSQRFRQAYAQGAEVGSYVSVNEILKDAERANSNALQAMDVFLNLTPESLTHKLYTGAVPLGRNPATIVTDIDVPQCIRDDTQISRRFLYVPLSKKIDWVGSLVTSGVHRFERLRLGEDRFVEAANAILSEIIDRWFDLPRTLVDIAKDLGYTTLDLATGFDDPIETLKDFYRAWKTTSPSTENRWAGGWRTLRREDSTQLAELWNILSDGGKNWFNSRRVKEQDWQKLLGTERAIRPELRKHGQTLGINFLESK